LAEFRKSAQYQISRKFVQLEQTNRLDDDNCALLGCYAASSTNFYRRFGTSYQSHPRSSRN